MAELVRRIGLVLVLWCCMPGWAAVSVGGGTEASRIVNGKLTITYTGDARYSYKGKTCQQTIVGVAGSLADQVSTLAQGCGLQTRNSTEVTNANGTITVSLELYSTYWFSSSVAFSEKHRGYECPEGSQLNTSDQCECKAGTMANANKDACIPACTAGMQYSSGYYPIGTNSAASPKLMGCVSYCEVVFDGVSPAGSNTVDGQKTWYAKGSYVGTGGVCTEETTVVESSETIPPDGCSEGKVQGTVNGKTVCVDNNDDTNVVPGDTTKSETTKETKTNEDGSTTTTETTKTTNPDGSTTTTTTTTTTRPDGTSTSTTTTTTTPGTGNGSGDGEGDGEETECEKNPSGSGCGGTPAEVGELWTPKGKTLESVLATHKAAMLGTPAGSAVVGFFSVSGGGSCPQSAGTIPLLNASVSFAPFCSGLGADVLGMLKAALLVVASFFAFRVAIE